MIAPTAPGIHIGGLTKQFKVGRSVVTALDGVDIQSDQGEFVTLLGPSGCGKTTTLRMIAGFETPTEGAIRLEGADVSRTPPNKRNVNTVFQHYALFPHMSVWDNVAYLSPRTAERLDCTERTVPSGRCTRYSRTKSCCSVTARRHAAGPGRAGRSRPPERPG